MKHHQKKMLIKARRIGAIILMCLLIQQLGLHNSQGDEQKISSTTFMSLVDNRELFHGERAEASTAPALSGQQQQQRRLSPPTIVTSHISAQSVIPMPPSPLPLVELSVGQHTYHEQRTMEQDNNRPTQSESTMKTEITSAVNDEIVSKLNHRVQRDQETRPKAVTKATIITETPHLVLVTNENLPDQIYVSDPTLPADFKANEKANIKKDKSILEWLKDKHRLKHAIVQTVLNEIEANKLSGGRYAVDSHKILASSSIVAARVPTSVPESIGTDKLSIILMEDRLLADNAKSGSKSILGSNKRIAPIITSVLSAPPQPPVISIDKRHGTDPCATGHKARCFSKFLFGDSHPNTEKNAAVNALASKTDLEHLISGEKSPKTPPPSMNTDPSQQFMHFG